MTLKMSMASMQEEEQLDVALSVVRLANTQSNAHRKERTDVPTNIRKIAVQNQPKANT
jgi:hypothetical protein